MRARMKKNSFFVMLFPIFFILASCGTTEQVAQSPQTAEEAVTQKQEDVANQIADTLNSTVSQEEPKPADSEESENSENDDGANSIEEQSENETVEALDSEEKTETIKSEDEEETEKNDVTKSEGEEYPEKSDATKSEDEEESDKNEIPASEAEELEVAEKVSEEDSSFDKDLEAAPTTDERGKVSEYPIFEEPEVIVLDLPEEEPKQSESEIEEKVDSPEEASEKTTPKITEIEIPESPSPSESIAPNKENAVPPVMPTAPKNAEESTEQTKIEAKTSESEAETNESEIGSETVEITPSRSVTLRNNQFLDVTYPGKGWTYIGESEKSALFNYIGRKFGSNNTTLSLRAKKTGTTLLHFYKNDALTGEYIDDYLAVTVEAKRSTGRVKAPSYADIVPAKPQRRLDRANENIKEDSKNETEKAENPAPAQNAESKEQKSAPQGTGTIQSTSEQWNAQSQKNNTEATKVAQSQNPPSSQENDVKTVIQTTDETAETTNSRRESQEYTPTSSQSESAVAQVSTEIQEEPQVISEGKATSTTSGEVDESLLEKAKQDFVDGKFEDALKEAQEYYNTASTRLDEALFLLGQISESNSGVKDIRFAVDSYDMLVKRFPTSPLWKQAKNRSIYLKRFYIDIR